MIALLMGLKTISCKELQARLAQDAVTVVDVNAPHSWLEARVPGAINLAVEFDAAALPADRAAGLVFYCSNPLCRKAPNAARRAQRLGYTDVRVLSSGIMGWLNAGLPVESGA